jgi:ABC-type multidrug transport system, ATPase component
MKAVEVKNLTVRFDDFTAVNKISFEVEEGEIFGFLGANGAGKTTTIRVLCGLLLPTEGSVSVVGVDVNSDPLQVKSQVGYMSQKFTLYDDMTVLENFEFSSTLRGLDPLKSQARQKELLQMIDYQKDVNTLVKDLPGGLKQQVSLANALIHDPKVVFLDEPTAGVTPYFRERFWKLIRSISDKGTTVFVTTHYMDEAEQCGRVALMKTGEIIALNSPKGLKEEIFKEPLYELSPLKELSRNETRELKEDQSLKSIKPHGRRFHALMKSKQTLIEFTQKYKGIIDVQEIVPSLEDVFIAAVEGKE